MEDHPQHGVPIVGCCWGFANERSPKMAQSLFNVITNLYIANMYNVNQMNPKGYDQFLLSDYFWPLAKLNSTIHDSYTCNEFKGMPFPKQRSELTSCFVGCVIMYKCCYSSNISEPNFICPIECRPSEHKDWKYC